LALAADSTAATRSSHDFILGAPGNGFAFHDPDPGSARNDPSGGKAPSTEEGGGVELVVFAVVLAADPNGLDCPHAAITGNERHAATHHPSDLVISF
jgi:hypothetical protein